MDVTSTDLRQAAWYPIAASDDLPLRHVFHGQLLGRELAVWRADDGNVNVWENRCLHRGVRLSIGINEAQNSSASTTAGAMPTTRPVAPISRPIRPMPQRAALPTAPTRCVRRSG